MISIRTLNSAGSCQKYIWFGVSKYLIEFHHACTGTIVTVIIYNPGNPPPQKYKYNFIITIKTVSPPPLKKRKQKKEKGDMLVNRVKSQALKN